jgi:hypothetical protein
MSWSKKKKDRLGRKSRTDFLAALGERLGGGLINEAITIESFLWSLLGAVVLLAIVNLVRRGSVR